MSLSESMTAAGRAMLFRLSLVLTLASRLASFPKLQVIYPVISAVTVFVVNALVPEKRSTQSLRHDPSVFKHSAGSVLHCAKQRQFFVSNIHRAQQDVTRVVARLAGMGTLALKRLAHSLSVFQLSAWPASTAEVSALHHRSKGSQGVPLLASAVGAHYRCAHGLHTIHSPHLCAVDLNSWMRGMQLEPAGHPIRSNFAGSAFSGESGPDHGRADQVRSLPANKPTFRTRHRHAKRSLLAVGHSRHCGKVDRSVVSFRHCQIVQGAA